MKKKFKGIFYLFLSFYGIYFSYSFFLPYLDKSLGFVEARNILIEEKIEAGAWYYIFVDKVENSSENVRNSLEYFLGD
ncbi:hypothetical protein [Cetobacterium sp. SF1]|uniref:hypothetical protein n=1 Tax=unclassified Cetobacterium TaxID=2630983 RepID=UPI003CF6325F